MLTREPGGIIAGGMTHPALSLFYAKKGDIAVIKGKESEIKDILYDAVRGIEYGRVTVHIQDGKIVYMDRTEKIKVKG